MCHLFEREPIRCPPIGSVPQAGGLEMGYLAKAIVTKCFVSGLEGPVGGGRGVHTPNYLGNITPFPLWQAGVGVEG